MRGTIFKILLLAFLMLVVFLKSVVSLLTLVLLSLLILVGYSHVPESYKPWTPLDLTDEINIFTSYKLKKLEEDFSACQAALERAEIEFTPLDDRQAGQCNLVNQISLNQSKYPYSGAVRGSCSLIAALVLWENQIITPAAEKYLDSEIARINHYGIFSCRNVAGSSRRSQHASAKAIDISGYQLDNGRAISVKSDWAKDTPEAAFLKEVHKESCKVFKGVLGPNYNAAHADHFHLDLGSYNICR